MGKLKCIHGEDRDTCRKCDNAAERKTPNGDQPGQRQNDDEE